MVMSLVVIVGRSDGGPDAAANFHVGKVGQVTSSRIAEIVPQHRHPAAHKASQVVRAVSKGTVPKETRVVTRSKIITP